MGGPRRTRRIRGTRPTALLSAVATLFAALFICAGAGDAHPAGARGPAVSVVSAALTPISSATPGVAAPRTAARAAAPADAHLTCPYDRRDCGLFSRVSPAVLSAPPPTSPLTADSQLPRLEPARDGGPLFRGGAHARAPDLHVLQVLRT